MGTCEVGNGDERQAPNVMIHRLIDTVPLESSLDYTLIEHFIRNTILILGRASLCSQNSLNASWHGSHKMLKTFVSLVSVDMIVSHNSYRFLGTLSCCESPILPCLKCVLWDLDPVSDKVTEEQ